MGALFKTALAGWWNDRAMSLGASIAFFTVFSLAPMLLVTIAIAGLVFGREAAQGAIVAQLAGLTGGQTAAALEGVLVSSIVDPAREGRPLLGGHRVKLDGGVGREAVVAGVGRKRKLRSGGSDSKAAVRHSRRPRLKCPRGSSSAAGRFWCSSQHLIGQTVSLG
jgi:Virulence factor BrkB